MFSLFRSLFTILFLTSSVSFSGNFSDIKVLQSDKNETVYELSITNFTLNEALFENEISYIKPKFENAVFPASESSYILPSRALQFIIPENGDISVEIISKTQKQFNNITIKKFETDLNNNTKNYKPNLVELGSKMRFRDMMNRTLILNPVSYNSDSKTVILSDKIVFKVSYSGIPQTTKVYKKSGRLDNIYKTSFINFEQAKNWQIRKAVKFFKANVLSLGTYYQFDVEEDGIYKITASTLDNIGIETDALDINSIQLYNNGGHMLSFSTIATQYNPEYTQEIAILVFDLNNNNLFDSNDYLLFYGKSVNGWFYNTATNRFDHQTHHFDTKNTYYLSVSGNSGKRMEFNPLPSVSTQSSQNYFIEKFHYEIDLYNLLSSGPDWYGYRFFGTSASHAINFDLNFQSGTAAASQIEMQMKGGSGIHYQEGGGHNYTFNISLNGSSISFPIFSNERRINRTIDLNDSFLRNGQNTINFIYTGSKEETTAHLDYFSISHPKSLAAKNKYLEFYTSTNNQSVEYLVSGLSDDDIYLLDITDPLNPATLLQDEDRAGNLSVIIPAESDMKKLIAFDLSSSQINSIANLKPYIPSNNLLDVNKSADFIIITRKSLLGYAEEIAELRDHLKTEVASVEDINFYFNSGVDDPTAIRNFLRYAYYNWQTPSLSYVLLFGDGHYDYRNIILADSIVVPTFQIYSALEISGLFGNSARESDLYFGDIDNESNSETQTLLRPSIAIGRLPIENALDAERAVEKLKNYQLNPIKDGWQTNITFVADDEKVSNPFSTEWLHQRDADEIARRANLNKYNINKIYLSAYPSTPGGRRFIKPEATNDLIDQINRGTLVLNYTGHGSPTQWAHETVFNFDRDYSKINNENRLPFIIAATCDFGLFDDPTRVSFSEALIWKENSGIIGIVAATRLVFASENDQFATAFYSDLFPVSGPSVELGQAFVSTINALAGTSSNINDQKYHLLADPSMTLADGRDEIEITSVFPDTLKALNEVSIKANIKVDGQTTTDFNGGAVIIINDAEYENVNTGGGLEYDLKGPLIFRGEVSVESGSLEGRFIVPKTIRYKNSNTGKVTFYAWDETTNSTAMGSNKNLLFLGSSTRNQENDGPELDIFFEDQENFRSGDMISANPILIARLSDESGINVTGQLGHKIELRLGEDEIIDVSQSFTYDRDSFTEGFIHYPLTSLSPGEHALTLLAYDNLNNRTEETVNFSITANSGIVLKDVINYPNPFKSKTDFTFQTNAEGADATVKIYTIAGRLIETLDGYSTIAGYNEIEWNGHDRDDNVLANGVYLYKIILKINGDTKEKIEKMVVLK